MAWSILGIVFLKIDQLVKHYIKILARFSFKVIFGFAARWHWYWPFVQLLTHVITERKSEGQTQGANAFTLLALSPNTFRGDLEMLANSERVRILQIPEHWQTRLIFLFYEQRERGYFDMDPAPGSKDAVSKQRLLRFLEGVLAAVYTRLGVDCVISSHLRWVADLDWGIASKSLGVPYVVLYREGLFASSADLREVMPSRFKKWGKFKASHLVVHNEIGRQFCIDLGYVEPFQVSSLGSMRMDNFIRRIKNHRTKTDGPKSVVLFPPPLYPDFTIGKPLFPVFKNVHVELAKLALRRPDLEIVFKPKVKDHCSWRRRIEHAFQDEEINIEDIQNLYIKPDSDAQDMILDATVVCGLNSTTMLEAAVAGKPVVVSMFSELRQPKFERHVKFRDALEYLDIAGDPKDFILLIEQRLEDPEVPAEIMAGRFQMFAKYVSAPEGGAVKRYEELFDRLIREAKKTSATEQ